MTSSFLNPLCRLFILSLLPLPSKTFTLSMSTSSSSSPPSTRFITNKMCPYAQKAWIALETIKASYNMEEISLYGANGKPDWFLKLNPEGTVPVLSCYDGMMVLADSEIILDFIQDGSVEGEDSLCLYPEEDEVKELVLEWRDIIMRKVAPIGKNAVLGGKRKELFAALKEIDGKVIGPFLCGEKITVADCAAFPFIWRIDQEFGLDGCDNIKAWLDACMGVDAFKKTVKSAWWWWW
mmetsp:Transcript_26575/g.32190  ORF Transcript_26575/g.32190 Transcript_26575/m.32190 type:complete len:237 (+) Transcript_26575:69-779(+)